MSGSGGSDTVGADGGGSDMEGSGGGTVWIRSSAGCCLLSPIIAGEEEDGARKTAFA